MARKPRVIELFAGAGLFGLAFRKAGFELTQAVELDRAAATTYALNLGNHVEVADVRKALPKAKCEVLLAGPPCQGFSTLGSRDVNDPRNSLSLEVVRWAKVTTPSVIVIENVAAFLDSPIWKTLTRSLRRLGYDTSAFTLDASDYGVPQLRRRSFTIASRIGSVGAIRKTATRKTTVREAWDGLRRTPDGKNNHFAPVASPIAMARMKVIPPGGDKRDVMKNAPHLAPSSWWKVTCEVTDAWGRMHWDEPSNTLRTAIQNASKGRYIHPEQHRVISLREAARLQSIPDSFCFSGYPLHIARQIGNSVPPRMGHAVAKSVAALF